MLIKNEDILKNMENHADAGPHWLL